MADLDRLKENIGDMEFRVKYTVESVVVTSATAECIDSFMASDFPKGGGSEADLERQFFAWCIAEDGYDFDEREAPQVLEISAA